MKTKISLQIIILLLLVNILSCDKIGSGQLFNDQSIASYVDNSPVLDNISNQSVGVGDAITQIDAGDGGDDVDADGDIISYSCYYDVVIDSIVLDELLCSTLSGVSFSETTGIMNWVPSNTQIGDFEFKIIALESDLTDEIIFTTTVLSKWQQEAYIKASNNDSNDFFGGNVSLHGDSLAVGALGEDSNQTTIINGTTASGDNSSENSGAVYVYRRIGENWSQEAYIKAVNSDSLDFFGISVSLYGDTLAVGAMWESSDQTTITNGATASNDISSGNSGAVYVYKRKNDVNWSQEAYIKASNNGPNDSFGMSISLHGDFLAVGAFYEDSNQTTITNGATASADNSNINSGAVYIYKRNGASWSQEAYIKASNNDISDSFGTSISLNGDSLVVGATGEASNQTTITNGITASNDDSNVDSGAVYIYRRAGLSGTSWSQEAYIKANNNDLNDHFGGSVSLDGDSLAVGIEDEDSNQTTITNGTTASNDDSNGESGAVFIYKRNGASWSQEAYIKAINNSSNDNFGGSVSLKGDTLAVGAIGEQSNQTTVTNGTIASSDNSKNASGAVYIYRRSENNWSQEAYIKASNNDSFDKFGDSVSLSGDTLAVGASYEESSQTTITNGTTASSDNSSADSGAVYIYRNNARLFEVTDIWATAGEFSVTLTWNKTGGSAKGYIFSYQMGEVAPSDCDSGIVVDAGDVNTYQELALSIDTTYSFRVCAYEDASTMTSGRTITITTEFVFYTN